jgi:hypothetical protein
MYLRAEYYRRRGLAAKERAAQTTDLSLREAFKDVARHWLALAERVWIERQHNSQQLMTHKKGSQDYRRLADQCRQAACTVSTEKERTELLARAKTFDLLAEHIVQQHPQNSMSRLNHWS